MAKDKRLDGQVALITGAGQGTGRGIALAMGKEGARIVLVGRTSSKIEAVAAELAAFGCNARAIVCDITSPSEVSQAIAETMQAYGRLDALINNAHSLTSTAPVEATTLDDLAINYQSGPLGTFYMMQAAFPLLKERGGTVINFGSSVAIEAAKGYAAYAMAKEAIRALTRVAAREWGQFDIRVNCICPTSRSPSMLKWEEADPKGFAAIAAQVPLGRMGDPEMDIGRAVMALCTDDFGYLTGATLMLNGGRVQVA